MKTFRQELTKDLRLEVSVLGGRNKIKTHIVQFINNNTGKVSMTVVTDNLEQFADKLAALDKAIAMEQYSKLMDIELNNH